ncbi:hypothetical protein AGLY_007498 [Aphis glycines]|uniref:Uncharacterized protein n=1 Tax=Aphis glycines TaxID=307491 RepID=A0A6G0TMR6_APHGL|nr:hypothetical protein AGLY_007498 [Aphis glycines]
MQFKIHILPYRNIPFMTLTGFKSIIRFKLHGNTTLLSPEGKISLRVSLSLFNCSHSFSNSDTLSLLPINSFNTSSLNIFLMCLSFEISNLNSSSNFFGNTLKLYCFTAKTIFTITQLNQLTNRVTYGSIIVNHNRLHSFYQTSLNITFLSSFYSCINKTFPTTHSVKVEF